MQEHEARGTQLLMQVIAPAGYGKSFATSAMKAMLEAKGHTVQICSFTGKAAANVGGQTLHSAMGISTDKRKELQKPDSWDFYVDKWADITCLLIDEFGFLEVRFWHLLDQVCP